MRSGFLFAQAPFASAHASTIAETAAGLVAAWFGGPQEGHPEVGIWLADEAQGGWSEPAEVAIGRGPDGRRQPCWNRCYASRGPVPCCCSTRSARIRAAGGAC